MKNLVFFLVLISACKPTTNSKNYDVSPMLKNIGENIVLPNYESLETKVLAMDDALLVLKNTPIAINLTDARNKFLETYLAWQKCSPYQFGPAADEALQTINVFPTDTNQINLNISSGTYDLDAASNIDASGFPALDFLLFYGTESQILNRLSNIEYSNYLISVSKQIKTKASAVKSSWESSYLSAFTTSTETSVGSSISLLTNAMILNFERNAREAKIGIPAGVRTLDQIVPDKIEALYSENSILLAKEHIAGFKELYEGKNGESFKSILISLDKETLANTIEVHLSDIEISLNTLSDPFYEMLEIDNAPALATYAEYQKLIPILKVDMTAALGLMITYSDSDGD